MQFATGAIVYLVVAVPLVSLGLLAWDVATTLNRGYLVARLYGELSDLVSDRLADGQEPLDDRHERRLRGIQDRAEIRLLHETAKTADLALGVVLQESDVDQFLTMLERLRARLARAAMRDLRRSTSDCVLAREVIDQGSRRIVAIRHAVTRRSVLTWGPPVLRRLGGRLLNAVAIGGLAGLIVGSVVWVLTASGAPDGAIDSQVSRIGTTATLGMLLGVLWVVVDVYVRVRKLDLRGMTRVELKQARRRERANLAMASVLLLASTALFVFGSSVIEPLKGVLPEIPSAPRIDLPRWGVGVALLAWGVVRTWRTWRSRSETQRLHLLNGLGDATVWIALGLSYLLLIYIDMNGFVLWTVVLLLFAPGGFFAITWWLGTQTRIRRNRALREAGVELRWVTPAWLAAAVVVATGTVVLSATWLVGYGWATGSRAAWVDSPAVWISMVMTTLATAYIAHRRQLRRVKAERDRRVRDFRERAAGNRPAPSDPSSPPL